MCSQHPNHLPSVFWFFYGFLWWIQTLVLDAQWDTGIFNSVITELFFLIPIFKYIFMFNRYLMLRFWDIFVTKILTYAPLKIFITYNYNTVTCIDAIQLTKLKNSKNKLKFRFMIIDHGSWCMRIKTANNE